MPDITIQGQIISFPSSGSSPNWSPAVIQFAEAVEDALSGVVGDFDVSPQTFIIDSTPNSTATNVPNLAFSTSQVRGAFIRYTIYRNTDSETVAEAGLIQIVYNDQSSVGQKWNVTQEAVGDGNVAFSVTDTGQVQVTLTALSGSGHEGQINYAAQAIEQEY